MLRTKLVLLALGGSRLVVRGRRLWRRREVSSGGDSGGGGETSLDLVIGVSLPLSGDLADFGPRRREGG